MQEVIATTAAAAADSVIESAENFTIGFYKNVVQNFHDTSTNEEEKKNLITSALSVHSVLSMTSTGATNNTALEMFKALKLAKVTDEEASSQQHLLAFQSFFDSFNNITNVVVKLANKIYVSKNLAIKDEFKKITSTYFRSDCDTLDYCSPQQSAKIINKWCSEKTNDKIKELVKEEDITGNTSIILLNAVYFKGDWMKKFNKNETKLKTFHLNKTSTVEVPTMFVKETFFYNEIIALDASYVVLPYANAATYMVIVMPNEIDGLKDIENNLEKVYASISKDYESFKNFHASFRQREIVLSLPKFQVETTIALNSHLQELGFKEMFTDRANFNGISDKPLKVDKVVQKAFIEVNEEGSEAAAATGLQMVLLCMPPPPMKLDIDRPFFFSIFHKNTTLFSGRVANPLVN